MPWVLPQEARKTFRTPAAMFQGIDDVANTLSFLTQCMIGGDDFSPVYESGVNAGKNKLSVYIQRNIPVWRGIRSAFIDINDNNKAEITNTIIPEFTDRGKYMEIIKNTDLSIDFEIFDNEFILFFVYSSALSKSNIIFCNGLIFIFPIVTIFFDTLTILIILQPPYIPKFSLFE